MSTVYLNGEYMPKDRATISVDDRGFLLSDGIYEVTPAYRGRLFRIAPSLGAALRFASVSRSPCGGRWLGLLEGLLPRSGSPDPCRELRPRQAGCRVLLRAFCRAVALRPGGPPTPELGLRLRGAGAPEQSRGGEEADGEGAERARGPRGGRGCRTLAAIVKASARLRIAESTRSLEVPSFVAYSIHPPPRLPATG